MRRVPFATRSIRNPFGASTTASNERLSMPNVFAADGMTGTKTLLRNEGTAFSRRSVPSVPASAAGAVARKTKIAREEISRVVIGYGAKHAVSHVNFVNALTSGKVIELRSKNE